MQLTASDVISLAINVVQNGFDYRELRPDLSFLVGGSATKPRGRGLGGEAPVPDTTRTMLEEVYREILRANAKHMGPIYLNEIRSAGRLRHTAGATFGSVSSANGGYCSTSEAW